MYKVSKEKGSSRYQLTDPQGNTVKGLTFTDKRKALHKAATLSGLDFKEYEKLRKEDKL